MKRDLNKKRVSIMAGVLGKDQDEAKHIENSMACGDESSQHIQKIIEEFEKTQQNKMRYQHPIFNRKFFISLVGITLGVLIGHFAVEPAIRVKYVYTNNPNDAKTILAEVIPETA